MKPVPPSRLLFPMIRIHPTLPSGWSDDHPSDQDGDGFITTAVGGEDCDDTDGNIFPGAEEVWYDGIDSNCDGLNDFDADMDGYVSSEAEDGDDCDDTNPDIYPGSADEWYDGVDSDCAGNDDFDQDGDGYASSL